MLKFIANNNSDTQHISNLSQSNQNEIDLETRQTPVGIDSSPRIPQLDGIRGLAMVLVLFCHYVMGEEAIEPTTLGEYILALFSFSWAGVDLFFVLSGFLIGGILLHQRQSPAYFRTFYVRRVCRIFPLYYLVLGLFIICKFSYVRGSVGTKEYWLLGDALPTWSYLSFLQNFTMASAGTPGARWEAATWSLAVEEQFYIVLPLMIRFIPTRLLNRYLIVLIIAAPITRAILLALYPNDWIPGYVLMPARMDALFLGVLGALAIRSPKGELWLRQHINWIKVVVAICFVVLTVLLIARQGLGSWGMCLIGHPSIAILSLGLILLATLTPSSYYAGFFRLKPLVWVGSVSYGIYLFHQPLLGIFHVLVLGQSPTFASWEGRIVTLIALLATLVLAKISWTLFEKPFVYIGKKFAY